MTNPAPDVLLIGAGDLGTEIGLRLAAAGHGVVAVRRRGALVPRPLAGVSGDIAAGLPSALPRFAGPGGGPRLVVICLTADGRDESAYRATFLDAVGRTLDDIAAREWAPERALFVSSTGVCAQHGDVDEMTPAAPSSPTSRVLLDAERAFLSRLPDGTRGTVIRPSGLYGPGREFFIDQVRSGAVTDPGRMTHRVHRDDAARAVMHLLTRREEPEELYLVTDDAPAPAGEVAAFIAARLGLPSRRAAAGDAPHSGPPRLLRNTRLRETGFTFTYPTYREGYAAVLDGVGDRHR